MQISWKKIRRPALWTAGLAALGLATTLAVTQMAESASPMRRVAPPGVAPQRAPSAFATTTLPPCTGNFSGGGQINVAQPTYLQDVPQGQVFCDFHTFAWNQFIYLIQMQADPNNGGKVTPLFLHMAPWYNLLKPTGAKPPTTYPGGSTALEAAGLDQGQAGDDDHLLDVKGATVRYDIRFNSYMYNAISSAGLWNQAGYTKACNPVASGPNQGNCQNGQLYLPPTTVGSPSQPIPGSLEVKTAWRDFGSAENCPATQFYCNGRYGLVGLHLVQKTQTHGEWIWASFEHVANDPDCYPQGDSPIAAQSPLGTPWSFFNPATAGSSVVGSQMCEVTGTSPQCNANPKYFLTQHLFIYKPVNICRTDYLPPGGASAVNCASVPDGPPQRSSNSGGNVACLNATLRPQLSGVWKNYKMIGSLWIRGTTGPTTNFTVQIFQTQQTGLPFGQPVGFPHLANTTMETWLQDGSTGYDPFGTPTQLGTNTQQAGCFLCHNMPTSTFEDDLSHYASKLPQGALRARLEELLPADSTKVVTEQPMQVTAPKPAKPGKPLRHH